MRAPLNAIDGRLTDLARTSAALLRGSRDPEAVHDLRVSIRALRAALRALKERIPAARLRKLEDALKRIFETTNAPRDHDVLAELARRYRVAARLPRASRAPMLRSLRSARARELPAELFRAFSEALGSGAAPPGAPSARRAIRRRAGRDRRKLRKRVSAVARHPRRATPGRLHRIRVELKRARYETEVFGTLLPRRASRAVRRFRKAQRELGAYHDLELLRERVSGRDDRAALRLERRKLRRSAIASLSTLRRRIR